MTQIDFVGAALRPVDATAVEDAARTLACEPAAIWAVCDVEAAGGGYLPDGRPKILFEAHIFSRLTGGRFDADHPAISVPAWDPKLYGAAGAHQYDRLGQAMALDGDAAMQSASWGMFQILGRNFRDCGFGQVQDLVVAAMHSEDDQLASFVAYCQRYGLGRHLHRRDWVSFARAYNGAREADHNYHGRLAAAFARHLAAPSPHAPMPERPAAPVLAADLAPAPAPAAAATSHQAAPVETSADELNREELQRLQGS